MARKKRSLVNLSHCVDNVMPPNLSIASSDAKEFTFGKEGSKIWKSAASAKFAAGMYVRTCRRLGIINRTLATNMDFDLTKLRDSLLTKSSSKQQKQSTKKRKIESRRTIPIPTLAQAKSQILQLEEIESEIELEKKASRFQQVWKKLRENGTFDPGWNDETGELTSNGPSISCNELLRFMKQKKPLLCDDEDFSADFDTIHVLEAIVALMLPAPTLYNQPLLVTKATLIPIGSSQKYQLSIGVYANRLLFECMTQQLQVVMSALDDSSFQVDQQLKEPPSKTLETNDFQSAEFPTIVFDSEDHDEEYDDKDAATQSDGKTLSAFSIPGFLKMIENKGTLDEDLWKNTLEPRLAHNPGCNMGLKTDLLLHQKHGVCWMYHHERIGNLNRLIWEKRKFHEGDTYYYSPALGQVRLFLSNDTDSTFDTGWGGGGVLSDEMGLGKTIQTLALVVATLEDVKQRAREQVEQCETEEERQSIHHATLIVVPPVLLAQWIAEIRKISPYLVVDSVVRGGGSIQRVQQPFSSNSQAKADIVLTTYHALEDNVTRSKKKRTRKRVDDDGLMSLVEQIWGRIVLDEMQEIRSSTARISKVVNTLQSECRWMLSGTPLVDDVSDLRGEMCFLGLEPFAYSNDDGFFDFAVANHWHQRSEYGLSVLQKLASLIILRRSKGMLVRQTGLPLLGLPPMTITYEPVPQDSSERALYCFLEFVTHSLMPDDVESKDNNESQTPQTDVQQYRNKNNFLRFLFEACLSPTMLNGGLGCPSQLDTLNRWMKEYNRLAHKNKEQQSSRNNDNSRTGSHQSQIRNILSCDEAITFLSQVEDLARTDSDFVTDIRVGGDGGLSSRQRAFDTLEVRYEQESTELESSKKQCAKASRTRARAYWQLALEGVTTGKLFINNDEYCNSRVNPKFRNLWSWRSCVLELSARCSVSARILPQMLIRGWRPSDKYFGDSPSRNRDDALMTLFRREPKLYWAHPYSLILLDIPNTISVADVQKSLLACLSAKLSVQRRDLNVTILPGQSISEAGTWKAVARFSNKDLYSFILSKTKTVEGIELNSENNPEWVEQKITQTKAILDEATAAHRVHPCAMSSQKLADAKRQYKMAKLGLRIFAQGSGDSRHVQCTKALGPIRSITPSTSQGLFSSALERIQDSSAYLQSNYSMVQLKARQLEEMKKQIEKGLNENIRHMTTVEALEALKTDHSEKSLCPICFETHGSAGKLVALTRCAHLSCKDCMTSWIRQKEARMQTPSCIECRKPIAYDQLVFVDPKKTSDQEELNKRRAEAKTLVQQAAEMLDNNHGHLEPRLWEALYLSMPLPSSVSYSSHNKYTAIPPLALAHVRNATSMPIHCTPSHYPDSDNLSLSTKVRALLADIPRDEKSVVFVTSKVAAAHLMVVMKRHGIGARGVYGSQTGEDSETSVSDWKGNSDIYVLIVQSGVAACGLTLTAASKMFFMHPLRRHEEEKQAYARIHRYGQEKEVFCKVYFAPVSVESRLLQWRHRFESESSESKFSEERMLIAPLRDVSEDSMDHAKSIESDQTQFLLGLT